MHVNDLKERKRERFAVYICVILGFRSKTTLETKVAQTNYKTVHKLGQALPLVAMFTVEWKPDELIFILYHAWWRCISGRGRYRLLYNCTKLISDPSLLLLLGSWFLNVNIFQYNAYLPLHNAKYLIVFGELAYCFLDSCKPPPPPPRSFFKNCR